MKFMWLAALLALVFSASIGSAQPLELGESSTISTSTAVLVPNVPADEDVGDLIFDLIGKVQSKAWGPSIGILMMILVWAASAFKLLNWAPEESKRWIVAGLCLAVAVGTGLAQSAPLTEILRAAFEATVTAIGSWELKKLPIKKVAAAKNG
jgi:ABC-type amino acid transport system permease subunit